jgi:hypothetical protein
MNVKHRTAHHSLILAMCLSAVPIVAVPAAAGQAEPAVSSLHGPSFVPDAKVGGSSLTAERTLGQAAWHAEGDGFVGTATGDGGWLVLDHPLQDTGFYTAFRCTGPCDVGVMLRMTKTENGMKGTFLSVDNGQLKTESLTLDIQGNIIARAELRTSRGAIRFATEQPDQTSLPDVLHDPAIYEVSPDSLPITKPHDGLRNGQWNELEALLDENILRGYLNDAGPDVSVATDNDDLDSFGQMALYVGKGSEVHFKNTAYKDIAMRVQPLEKVGSRFRMQRLTPFYYNWTAVAADFNHDGKLDLISGPYLYYGPDFTRSREIYPARSFSPSTEYSTWIQHTADFNGDGWPDVVATNLSRGAILYINPGTSSRRWKEYRVIPTMAAENSILADIDGDGKPELVYVADGYMRYAKPDPANPTAPWIVRSVSKQGPWAAHGIGVGDINGDGRKDIVGAYGWWEQPVNNDGDLPWKYHAEAFGRWGRIGLGGATIGIYDINGDGLNDVVTSLEAHSFGLAWFEQKRTSNGDISFVRHMVMDDYNTQNAGGVTFAELHGSGIADVDGDGIPDFIVGKRQFSHKDDLLDPDVWGPPLLYWYRTVRDKSAPGGAKLVPELIHNDSGAGDNLLPVDLNGDGVMDIVTATKRGLYVFWGQHIKTDAGK